LENQQRYPAAEVERMMKLQDVLLKAMAKKITWWEAAEIIGVTDRTMRRWRERLNEHGYSGLADRRKNKPSEKRVPLETAQEVLRLYQESYYDLNIRHFHEKLREEHGMAGCTVTIHEHLDGTVSVRYGPHVVGRYGAEGEALHKERKKAGESCGKAGAVETVENQPQVFHRSHRPLEIPQKRRDSHFPTAPAAAAYLPSKTRKPPSASRRGTAGAIR